MRDYSMSNIEKFSVEDGMSFLDSVFEEPSEDAERKIERVKCLLGQLPEREADFLELYYFRHMKQTDIATIFGVSQPTVHYRLNRAASRIKFMMHLPDIPIDEVRDLLEKIFSDPIDVEILIGMWHTTCQSQVAKNLSMSQGKVRHRFLRSLNRLWEFFGETKKSMEASDAYDKICSINEGGTEKQLEGLVVELFEAVSQNLNLLREVQRPVFEQSVTLHLD